MWKSTIIFVIATLTSFSCFPRNTETGLSSIVNSIGSLVSDFPSSETGAKVAKWKPEDGVNPEELGDTYVEGDMILGNQITRNGLVAESARWKGGIVPYQISDDFNYKDYNTIMAAIEEYHKNTCVKWVRWSGEPDYVYFQPSQTGCWSHVGKTGGKQVLNLQSPSCLVKKGTVMHEMLHALGFQHEQNRYDRDKFITINWQNIKNGQEQNFVKAEPGTIDDQGVPYDYGSVMHYSATAFSNNGKPTIVPKKKVDIGQREGFSKGDIKKIRKMYKCDADSIFSGILSQITG